MDKKFLSTAPYTGMGRGLQISVFLFALAASIVLGYVVSNTQISHLILPLAALLVFVIAFVNTEAAIYFLIFSMLLSPEYVVGEISGQSTLDRGLTLRVDDFLILVIGFAWFAKSAVHKNLGLFKKTPINRAMAGYLVVCALATAVGVFGGRVVPKTGFFFVLKYFEYFIVFFMVANHLSTQRQAERMLGFFFLTAFVVSIYGTLQIPGGGRVSAPFEGEIGEPNTLGGYILFVGCLASGLYLYVKKRQDRFLYGILLLAMALPFMFTESRTSYVALIGTVFVMAVLSRKKSAMITLVLICMLVSPLILPDRVTKRISSTFTTEEARPDQVEIAGFRLDTSTSARIQSWHLAIVNWVKKPVLGYGITGFKFMDSQFPKILLETGALGLLAFLYLLFRIGKLAFQRRREAQTPYFQGLTTGFLAGFIALIFHSLAANTFIIVRIMEPFWFVTAIIVVYPDLMPEPVESKQPPGFPKYGRRRYLHIQEEESSP